MDSLNIVFTGKEQLQVVREPVPEPAPDELLVETTRTLISTGTELICFTQSFAEGTHWHNWVKCPFYPGYSSVGRVLAVGSEVTGFQPGDRVASRTPHRQRFVVKASRATPVPDGISDTEATWFGLANIVQIGVRRAEHVLGDTVVVVGAGLLGQLVVQYARLLGAREVIAIDLAPKRLEMAAAHGATSTLCVNASEALAEVSRLTDGRLADVVYDVTGHSAVFPQALRLARRFGTVVLLGDAGSPSEQRLTPDVITRGLKIVGAHDGHPPAVSTDHSYWSHPRMTDLFFTYLQRGQMEVEDLMTHEFRPEQAAEAYGFLARDRSGAMGVAFVYGKG